VPLDVANDPAEIGLELAQAPVGALELMGMGVALELDRGSTSIHHAGVAYRGAGGGRRRSYIFPPLTRSVPPFLLRK
jgi:hypothetical protein